MPQIFSYEVNVKGQNWQSIINAPSVGKAKYYYLLQVQDPWPSVRFVDLICRKLGPPHTSESFKRNACYRGLPNVRCGDRVTVNGCNGTIVGHNSAANFQVLFDLDAPKYSGLTLPVHPNELQVII